MSKKHQTKTEINESEQQQQNEEEKKKYLRNSLMQSGCIDNTRSTIHTMIKKSG